MDILKFVVNGNDPIAGTEIYGSTKPCSFSVELKKQLQEKVERQLAVNIERAQFDFLLTDGLCANSEGLNSAANRNWAAPPTVDELRAKMYELIRLIDKAPKFDPNKTFTWNQKLTTVDIKLPVVSINNITI